MKKAFSVIIFLANISAFAQPIDGEIYFIKTFHGQFVSAFGNGLRLGDDAQKTAFTIVKQGDRTYFKAEHGIYVSAYERNQNDVDSHGRVRFQLRPQSWEAFSLQEMGGEKYRIRSKQWKTYLRANLNKQIVDQTNIAQEWELFELIKAHADDFPGNESKYNLVFFGDSLMDAPGIEWNERYPDLIREKLKKENPKWNVINAGIGGNTTVDGLARIHAALDQAHIVFICLGGNDFLRGIPSAEAKANLTRIIEIAKSRGAHPVLAGLKGPAWAKMVGGVAESYSSHRNPYSYETAIEQIAREQSVPILDDVLSAVPRLGFWGSLLRWSYFDPSYMVDLIHPNAEGHRRTAEHVYEFLKGEIGRYEASLSRNIEPAS